MLPSDYSGAPQLDRDVFRRGQPEPIAHIKHPQWTRNTLRLAFGLRAAAAEDARSRMCGFAKRTVWSLAEAREALERLIGQSADWARLDEFLIAYRGRAVDGGDGAGVELRVHARNGARGRDGGAPAGRVRALYVRKRQQSGNGVADTGGVAAPSGDGKG